MDLELAKARAHPGCETALTQSKDGPGAHKQESSNGDQAEYRQGGGAESPDTGSLLPSGRVQHRATRVGTVANRTKTLALSCQSFGLIAGREGQSLVLGQIRDHAVGKPGTRDGNGFFGEQSLGAGLEAIRALLHRHAAVGAIEVHGVNDPGGRYMTFLSVREAFLEKLELHIFEGLENDMGVVHLRVEDPPRGDGGDEGEQSPERKHRVGS